MTALIALLALAVGLALGLLAGRLLARRDERVLLGLRTVEGVAMVDLAALGRSMEAGPLAGLVEDGFLEARSGRITATTAGRPVLDAVLKALLA